MATAITSLVEGALPILRRYGALRALLVLLLAAVPQKAQAQIIRGTVVEQVTGAPVEGAAVTVLREVGGGDLESAGLTVTDEEGEFLVEVDRAGRYRVQGEFDGFSTPLSGWLEAGGVDPMPPVELILPSSQLRSALICQGQGGEGTAALVGVVRDTETGVALPEARVLAFWDGGGVERSAKSTSDGAGRYRICPPGDAGLVRFEVHLLGRMHTPPSVPLPGPAVVFHDLELALATSGGPADPVPEPIVLEAAGRELADLSGEILDGSAGRPLPGVIVRVEGTPLQLLSDDDGRFVFSGIRPGVYALSLRSLGYDGATAPVEVESGQSVHVRLALEARAVEIDGVVVTARSQAESAIRTSPFRRGIVYGEVMALEEERGARAFEVLSRSAPGIRVRQHWRENAPPLLCIETNRRIQRIQQGGGGGGGVAGLLDPDDGCDNAQVVVDGVRIADGADFLLRTPAGDIESIEFVTPVQAQITYGIGGDTANGVVVVWTRGKGPYASPLRDRE